MNQMRAVIRGKEIRFKTFLELGLKRGRFGGPENDFALDVSGDESFPDTREWRTMREYLISAGALPECIEAAEKLFKRWKAAQ